MFNRTVVAFVAVFALLFSALVIAEDRVTPVRPVGPLVQIAILLDTSSSMDGLIDQARTQLWSIVNEFAKAKKDGLTPHLQVALYEYGNSGLESQSGWIRQVVPLTDDLDAISDKLFALKTNGGEEYCGQVIQHATNNLAWDSNPKVFKAIFIAGNEPFSQGPVDFHVSVPAALQKGIVVNTIHCGSESDGREGKWTEGAKLGEGQAMVIDQNKAVVAIAAPQDDQINKLSAELNTTYIPFGAQGATRFEMQSANDTRAAAAAPTGAAVARAAAKASSNYRNASWDLADAIKEKTVDLAKLDAKDLPENMQKMSVEERKAYVETQQKKREEIQKQIQSLNTDREKFVAEKRKEQSGPDTLDVAFKKAIQQQLKDRQFEIKE